MHEMFGMQNYFVQICIVKWLTVQPHRRKIEYFVLTCYLLCILCLLLACVISEATEKKMYMQRLPMRVFLVCVCDFFLLLSNLTHLIIYF